MAKPNIDLIRRIVNQGRLKDLLDLMEGYSPYSDENLVENIPKKIGSGSARWDQLYTYRMAVEHIRFVLKYGSDINHIVEKDGKVYSSYPDYFEKWLNEGCCGLHQEEVVILGLHHA